MVIVKICASAQGTLLASVQRLSGLLFSRAPFFSNGFLPTWFFGWEGTIHPFWPCIDFSCHNCCDRLSWL